MSFFWLLFAPLGCSATSLLTWSESPLNWKQSAIPTADAKHPAVRIISIWEPAEGYGLDGLPARGFAGQVLFFAQGNAVPAKVDGDVRIYLFDDQGTLEEQAKPIHQFDFLGDAWTVHLQKSTLGPAYNVFIPYVRKHSLQTTCTLRIRLIAKEGPTIFSEMVHVTLPGRSKPDAAGKASSQPPLTADAASTGDVQLSASLTRKRVAITEITDRSALALSETAAREQAGNNGDDRDGAVPDTNPRQPASTAAPPKLLKSSAGRESKLEKAERLLDELREESPAKGAMHSATPTDQRPQHARRFQLTPREAATEDDSEQGRFPKDDQTGVASAGRSSKPHPLDDVVHSDHPLFDLYPLTKPGSGD